EATSPLRQASQTASGASRSPWPASGLFHHSTARLRIGCAKSTRKATSAAAAGSMAAGCRVSESSGTGLTVAVMPLPAATPEQDHRHRLEHDPEVLQQALPLDVFQVEADLPADIVQAAVVVMVDLRQAGDPRLGTLAQRVFGDVLPQLGKDHRALGARAHDVHLALEHVDELGQLVDPVLAQVAADPGDPRIMLLRPDGAGVLFRVHPHRAELVDVE